MENKRLAKLSAVAFISILLCLHITSLPATGEEQTKHYGGTLKIGFYTEVLNFMLAMHTHSETSQVGNKILEGLLKYDFDLSPKPGLAESWEISTDGLSYTFNLVHNATWHDGEPFTSADVKYSFEELHKKYKPGLSMILGSLEKIETPDEYTVIFKFLEPKPAFIYYLGDNSMGGVIFPKHLYEGTDPLTNPCNNAPVGTGPFMFEEWKVGEYVKLKRNPNYYREGKPYLDGIIFRIIKDRTALTMAFQQREVDAIFIGVGPADAAFLLETYPDAYVDIKGHGREFQSRIVFHLLNHNNEFIRDINVRKALMHSLDREKMCELAYFGVALPAYSYFFPGTWAFNEEATFEDLYPFDLDKANQILDEAGYEKGTDGIRFVLDGEVPIQYVEETLCYELWAEDLRKIGIDFQYVTIERSVGLTHFEDMTYGAIGCSGAFHGPDPAVAIARWLHSDNIGKPYFGNHFNYSNPRVDELLDIAMVSPDIEVQREALYEVQEILIEDIPYIPHVVYSPALVYWEDEWGGIPDGPAISSGECGAEYWWKLGYDVSPESVLARLSDCEQHLEALRSQFYDVTDAQKKLEEAKTAYAAGDYNSAMALLDEAMGLPVPPYWLYAIIVIVIAVPVIGLLYFYRKRKRSES